MLKKTISYTDFFGQARTEDFYFNLSKAELVEMQFTAPNGDFSNHLQTLIDTTDRKQIMQSFKEIIVSSYGIRTEDGRFFEKSPAIANRFLSSAAYSELLLSLLGEEDALLDFIQGLVPVDLQEAIAEQAAPLRTKTDMTPRERSEAQMQGHQKPAMPQPVPAVQTAVVADPYMPTDSAVITNTSPDVVVNQNARPDLSSLSHEQLTALVQQNQAQQNLA